MKRALLVVAVAVFAVSLLAAQEKSTQAAETAAQSWLSLVDKADYAASWQQASAYFKGAVTQEKWIDSMHAVRGPLGSVQSRNRVGARYTTSLPGAPDGQYVMMQFDTTFANKKSAVETVIFMLDKDGQWRAAGYFIR